jgi:putative tryptophan/tyrosine transport system substrate-binding protein
MRRMATSLLAIAIAAGVAGSLLPGTGQEAGRTYRVGILSALTREAPVWVAFRDRLSRSGYVEGKSLTLGHRAYGTKPEQATALAAALVQSGDEVIVASGGPAIVAAQAATRTIPILGTADDMVASGLVPSLARPGGNLTGISILATELDGKRQEILMELVPASRRMAALVDPSVTAPLQLETLRNATGMRGVELSIYPVRGPEEIAAAIERAQAAGATALNVLASPILNANRKVILDRSAALRLPAIYQWPETAEEGGLVAYGPPITKVFRRLADQLVMLLRSAKPADLPVEQPTTFELVVNLKTAKALGLTVPPLILARADEVIE